MKNLFFLSGLVCCSVYAGDCHSFLREYFGRDVMLSPLQQGDSYDRVYRVLDDKKIYFLKEYDASRSLWERCYMADVYTQMGALSISPKVLYVSSNCSCVLTQYIEGRALPMYSSPSLYFSILSLIKKMHGMLKSVPSSGTCMHKQIQGRYSELREYAIPLFFHAIYKRLKPLYNCVLCAMSQAHNDLHPSNIIIDNKGLAYIVDWDEIMSGTFLDDIGVFSLYLADELPLTLSGDEWARVLVAQYRYMLHTALWALRRYMEDDSQKSLQCSATGSARTLLYQYGYTQSPKSSLFYGYLACALMQELGKREAEINVLSRMIGEYNDQ